MGSAGRVETRGRRGVVGRIILPTGVEGGEGLTSWRRWNQNHRDIPTLCKACSLAYSFVSMYDFTARTVRTAYTKAVPATHFGACGIP